MTYACEPYIPPESRMCGETHCTRLADTSQEAAWCKCLTFDGKKIPNCEPKGSTAPIASNSCYNKATGQQRNISQDACQDLRDGDRNWRWAQCYCCCSCFAWDTKVKMPNEVRFIQEIEVDDEVLAAWIETDSDGKLQVSWKPQEVSYSDGTSPTGEPQTMVAIQFGEDGELIATPDQLFLLPNGKLKDAKLLVPGDQLVDDDGNAVEIKSLALGEYDGGIHHLGLGPAPENTNVPVSGNLFSTNGIISGDFWLQVTYASDTNEFSVLVDNHDRLPLIGSEEYAESKDYAADLFSATLKGFEPRPIVSRNFAAFHAVDESCVPKDARSYVTRKQAGAIKKADHYSVSMEYNMADFHWLQRQFAGFFPDINIYLEWADEMPNMYGFEQYGQKTVYVSGRLLRTKEMYWQGLAMIAAHGVALFYAGSPDESGYPCTAQADNFGAGYILRKCFDPNWADVATDGYRQVRDLFKHIPDRLRKGDPDNRCLSPSIGCRLESIDNALSGKPLPACAGVPQPGRLELRRANAEVVEGEQSVVVDFNEPVGESAENVTHYTITPETVVTTALRDENDESKVVLTVTFPDPPEGEYELNVHDILAADGSTLNPFGRTAYFEVSSDGP